MEDIHRWRDAIVDEQQRASAWWMSDRIARQRFLDLDARAQSQLSSAFGAWQECSRRLDLMACGALRDDANTEELALSSSPLSRAVSCSPR